MKPRLLREVTEFLASSKDDPNIPHLAVEFERYVQRAGLRATPPPSPTETAKQLEVLSKRLVQKHEFSPGQFVQWKEGLQNRRRPGYGEPVVVVQVLDQPVLEGSDSGSAYFREPLDIIIGLLDEDRELLLFHFDSRRFEPFS